MNGTNESSRPLLAAIGGIAGPVSTIGSTAANDSTTTARSTTDCIPSNDNSIHYIFGEEDGVELVWHRLQVDEFEVYVEGKYRNTNNHRLESTGAGVEFYNSDGVQIGRNYDIEYEELLAHRTRMFKVPLNGQGEVSSYRLGVAGTPPDNEEEESNDNSDEFGAKTTTS